jgi:cytochrome P450
VRVAAGAIGRSAFNVTVPTDAALSEFDFLSSDVIEDPFKANAIARRDAPVYQLPGTSIYMVSTFDLIAEACANPVALSNDFSMLLEGHARSDAEIQAVIGNGWPQMNTLLTADPPAHTRYRKLVNLAFSPLRVNKIESHIERIVDELIDRFIDKGRCEFVSEFGVPLPVTVIADQIGVPRADVAQLKEWSDAVADRLGGMLTRDQELDCAHIWSTPGSRMKGRWRPRSCSASCSSCWWPATRRPPTH